MGKSLIAALITLFLSSPFLLLAQQRDSVWYVQEARKLGNIGMQLNYEGKNIEALDTFKLVLEYRKKAYGNADYRLGPAYLAVGIGYFKLGQNDLALKNFEMAEENYLLRDKPSYVSLGRLYKNISNVYRAKLDYNNALHYAQQALETYKKDDPVDIFGVHDAYYAIAEIKYSLKDYKEALSILQNYYERTDDFNKIYYSELIAIIYQTLDEYGDASRFYEITINLMKDYFGENDMQVAIEYLNYADFFGEIGRFEKGIETLNKAYHIIHNYQSTKGIELASYHEYKGDLFRKRKIESPNISSFITQKKQNLNEAIKLYHKSLLALYTGNNSLQIDQLTVDNTLSFTDCLVLLKTVADTYNELALLDKEQQSTSYLTNLEEALNYYEIIGELIQRARMEISGDESKIQLTKLQYETFAKTIETAYLAYEIDHEEKHLLLAFNNSEQIKSSAVFDKISNDLAQENSLIPDSLLELESKLNNTISIYNEKIFEENSNASPDSSLLSEYSNKVFEANRRRDELNRMLEEEYPDYYNLKYSKSLLSIDEIQNMLGKKDAILEYVLNESDSLSELYTFVISKDKQLFTRQEINPQMANSMEYIFNFMTSPNYIFTRNEDAIEFCLSAHSMYQLLIQPFESELANKNLTIIPDGKLNYIAFDGLLKSLPDTSKLIDFSQLAYLVRDFNVNYANSANILMSNKKQKRHLQNEVLAFAPKYNSEQFELSNASYTLLPLPGVQKEVDAIAETVRTEIYRGDNATEENFRALNQNFDVLHLAMHAYINDSLPAYSRLAFSPEKGEHSLETDGWLNTADIYNLDLKNVRLTVLSACNTGIGKMQKGEGLMSLARGFLFAGCPSIVMSLWEVEDNAGTQIMTSFYKNLKNGKTKDEALRLAKIKYLENSNSRLAHPHYWMSFKCIGDQSPIYTSHDMYFFAVLIVLILAFTTDQGLRIRKARQKRRAS